MTPPDGRNDSPSQESLESGVLELTWDTFGEFCRALAVKVSRSGYDPDLVVGIATAGVIPGAVIASMLQCDFFSMKITRRSGRIRVRDEPEILSAAPPQAAQQRVLLVDEICSSGATLKLALTALHSVSPAEVRSATSIVKQGGYRPDYSAIETDAEVVFPWNRRIVGPNGELEPNPEYRDLL